MTTDDDSPAETAAIGPTANGGGYVSVTDDEGWKALLDAQAAGSSASSTPRPAPSVQPLPEPPRRSFRLLFGRRAPALDRPASGGRASGGRG